MKAGARFLRIARISGAHGLTGRLKITVITDIIERFTPGNSLYIKIGDDYKEFLCTEFIEKAGKNSLIKLDGIDNRDIAEELCGSELFITKDEAERTRKYLGDDVFYHSDLIGCQVFYKDKFFGFVKEIIEAGENSVLIIEDEETNEFLVPFIHSMVKTENIFSGRIDITPIDGLLD
ncbi:MAG: 16S rRNA processing protein RimM [Spirochaetes bacterium]|nr:16S rRNA processing protein RimM [Spirochaetota bacterium]